MKVDFKMLSEQKKHLVNVIDELYSFDRDSEQQKALESILHLIDAIEDANEVGTPIIIKPV